LKINVVSYSKNAVYYSISSFPIAGCYYFKITKWPDFLVGIVVKENHQLKINVVLYGIKAVYYISRCVYRCSQSRPHRLDGGNTSKICGIGIKRDTLDIPVQRAWGSTTIPLKRDTRILKTPGN